MTSFTDFVAAATGHEPYPYQERIAAQGLPELLSVPTGAGKTAAVVLGWLWRRRFHADAAIREATPHWLVFCLPMRVLTEQVTSEVNRWLQALGLGDEVLVHVVMGGSERPGERLRLEPERDAVVIGTMDMLLSRALNRGYGASRFTWPIDFGLLHNGCHWVFDEVQLMGPALPTSRQLEGLRLSIGTALPCSSTWMSATIDADSLWTVDNPAIASRLELSSGDRTGALGARLQAEKTLARIEVDSRHRESGIASALLAHHRPGTLSIAVMNTVKSARLLYLELAGRAQVEVVLLHSRFRPGDRRRQLERCLSPVEDSGPGRIVVSTQVLEAGVDLSAATLFTEAAPWPSIVQRAGRCNRDGRIPDAMLLWAPPERPEPYAATDLARSQAALTELEGQTLSPETIGRQEVDVERIVHPVLRRRDLLALFDTAPDLSGNDLDVAPYIRVSEDLDLLVAWRPLGGSPPGEDQTMPGSDELCPVPLGAESRTYLSDSSWAFDHLAGSWTRLDPRRARPGLVVLVDAAKGGYRTDTGWDPASRDRVPVHAQLGAPNLVEPEEAVGDDLVTFATARWVKLAQHLSDVASATGEILARLAPAGLPAGAAEAAVWAAQLHDVGKAHPVFQGTMERCADEDELEMVRAGAPWAKPGSKRKPRHARKFFRHELASALALLGEGAAVLEGVEERDLIVYLVAAHHGRVRLGIRSLPGVDDGSVLGILDGEHLPAVETPVGSLPETALSLDPVRIGSRGGVPSWSQRSLALLSRPDLGPFRLGFLEAVVRLADWRASAMTERVAP